MRLAAALLIAGAPAPVRANEPTEGQAGSTTELAKTSENPVGDLIFIPLQFNFDNGGEGSAIARS